MGAAADKLNHDADVLDQVAGYADYFAALADNAGDTDHAARIREQKVVLTDWSGLCRVAAASAQD